MAQAVGQELFALAEGLGTRRLLVDFENVASLTSTVLGLLLHLREDLQARGGRLTLCRLSPLVDEVFRVTRLHTLFDIRRELPADPLS